MQFEIQLKKIFSLFSFFLPMVCVYIGIGKKSPRHKSNVFIQQNETERKFDISQKEKTS